MEILLENCQGTTTMWSFVLSLPLWNRITGFIRPPRILYPMAPTQTSPVNKNQVYCPKTLLGTQVMHFRTSGRSTVIGYRRSPGSRIETKIGNDMSRPSVAKMHRSCFPFYLKNPKLNVQFTLKIMLQNTS